MSRIVSLSDKISLSEIEDLIDLVDYFDEQTDIRDFVTDPANGITALLISHGDPSEISRDASGTVYNSNPARLIIRATDEQSGEMTISVNLPLIEYTSLDAWLETAPNTITLHNEHTRGWDQTVYERNWRGWYLSYFESTGVTFPAVGYLTRYYSDYELNFEVSSASYIYLDCSITLSPHLTGDYNYDALRDVDGWDDIFDRFDEEMIISNHKDFISFLDNMSDRELRLYAEEAFTERGFRVSKIAFERLVNRGFPNSKNDLACVTQAMERSRQH